MHYFNIHRINNIFIDPYNKNNTKFIGLILNISIIKTKSGKFLYCLKLDNGKYKIYDVLIFNTLYDQIKDWVAVNKIIIFQGQSVFNNKTKQSTIYIKIIYSLEDFLNANINTIIFKTSLQNLKILNNILFSLNNICKNKNCKSKNFEIKIFDKKWVCKSKKILEIDLLNFSNYFELCLKHNIEVNFE